MADTLVIDLDSLVCAKDNADKARGQVDQIKGSVPLATVATAMPSKRGRSGCVCGFAHRRARKEDHGLARNLLHGPPGRDEPMQFHGSTRLGGFQSVLNKDIGKGRVMVDWQNVTAWDASILDTVVDNLIAERKNATPRASRFKTSTKT